MMVRRTSTVRRRGLTAYKVHELLMGKIKYPLQDYDGYGDMLSTRALTASPRITSAMRCARTGERTARRFWPSGAAAGCAMTDTLAEFGLNVRMKPWLLVRGSAEYTALGGEAVRLGGKVATQIATQTLRGFSRGCRSEALETRDWQGLGGVAKHQKKQ